MGRWPYLMYVRHSPLNVLRCRIVGRHAGRHKLLFVIVFAQNLVIVQVKSISHTKPIFNVRNSAKINYLINLRIYGLPLMALLTGETVEMVDVTFSPHDHFKRRDGFAASSATAGRSKHSIYSLQFN